MAVRAVYTKQLVNRNIKRFEFDGVYKDVLGTPGVSGIWIIFGRDKNGKTWFSSKLAEYLSKFSTVLYVSGEEGLDDTFIETIMRAKIDFGNRRLKFTEYVTLEELDKYLSKRQAPKIVFIDNMTIYNDELKNGEFRRFTKKHENKLIVFIAHEDKGEPLYSTGKLCKRLSKIIVRIEGLKAFVSGRCPGGELTIDENKARLYYGVNVNQ